MTDEEFRDMALDAFKVLPTGDYHYPFAPNQLRHFAALVAAMRDARACRIVYGLCASDNEAQRIVDAITKEGKT
jgi:hypothetical protein